MSMPIKSICWMVVFLLLLSRHYKVICLLISKAIFFFDFRRFLFGFRVADSPIPNSQNKLGGVCLCTSIDLCLTLCGICFPGNRPKCFNTVMVDANACICSSLFCSFFWFHSYSWFCVFICIKAEVDRQKRHVTTDLKWFCRKFFRHALKYLRFIVWRLESRCQ